MPKFYKYKAFISYSHQDKKWGDWLHKKLEAYQVPKELVGKQTKVGVVPKRLFPIFRDREELPTSSKLGEVIAQALQESSHLVIICSPRSAQSQWVNEEIKYFKNLGKADRILCIIVDGEPYGADKTELGLEECFPEAAKYEIGENGELTNKRTEPIAADARENKDGKENALLKLIAGLLDVGFDDLKQRDLARKQKRMAIFSGASMTLVAIMAGLTFWAHDQKREAERQQKIAVKSKDIAEEARSTANEQKQKAEKSEEEALKSQKEAEWKNYVNEIGLAEAKIKAGDFALAEEILWETDPEFRNWEWGYLLEKSNPYIWKFEDTIRVQTSSISNDRKILAICNDKTLEIINLKTLSKKKIGTHGHQRVMHVSFSSDDSKLISVGGKSIKIWDIKNEDVKPKEFSKHQTNVISAEFLQEDKLVMSASSSRDHLIDSTIKFWNPETLVESRSYNFGRYLRTAVISPNESKIVIGKWKRMYIRSFGNKKIKDFELNGYGVTNIDFSNDGSKFLTSGNKDINIFFDSNISLHKTLEWKEGIVTSDRITSARFSDNDNRIAATLLSGKVKVWKNEEPELEFIAHNGGLFDIDFFEDDIGLVTSGEDGVIVWRINDFHSQNSLPSTFGTHKTSIDGKRFLELNRNGSGLSNADKQNHIDVIDLTLKSDKIRFYKSLKNDFLTCGEFFETVEGKVVIGTEKGNVLVYDYIRKKIIFEKANIHEPLVNVVLAKNEQKIYVCYPNKLLLIDAHTGQLLEQILGTKRAIRSFHMSPQKDRFIICFWSDLKICDLNTGKSVTIGSENFMSTQISSLAFSKNRSDIGVATKDGKIFTINSDNGDMKLVIQGQNEQIDSLLFSPDSKRLFSVNKRGGRSIFDSSKGTFLLSFQGGHKGRDKAVSFYGNSFDLRVGRKIYKSQIPTITRAQFYKQKKERFLDWLNSNENILEN